LHNKQIPLIEGGVSSDTYWLAEALGKRGHKIFIVTNTLEFESEYKEEMTNNDLNYLEPKNVIF